MQSMMSDFLDKYLTESNKYNVQVDFGRRQSIATLTLGNFLQQKIEFHFFPKVFSKQSPSSKKKTVEFKSRATSETKRNVQQDFQASHMEDFQCKAA